MDSSFEKRFEDHMRSDEKAFDRIATAVEKLTENDKNIIGVLERLGTVETNVSWLMKWFWAVMTPMAGALVVAILALVFAKK